jgi:competence protein ComEC
MHPPPDFQERRQADRWRNLNNNSLVIRAAFGQISFLFPGDITAKAEEELLNYSGERLKSTVLVIPHHGSATSSSPGFVRAVQPSVGIVSAGWQNRYKFPHPTVIDCYRRQQTRLLRTDRDGAISLTADGRKLSVCTVSGGCD